MSRLVDPTLCPDCRARLDSNATCPDCGLRLSGPLAPQLWQAMVVADGILERLRVAPLAPLTPHPSPSPVSGAAPHPGTGPTEGRRRHGLPAASVPMVLLGLGGLCLLVAAVVFVAVAWSVLGLTGRTLVLLGVTAMLTGAAVVLTRRGLRGAAETMWVVVAGMLTVDLLGAQSAGLLGLDRLGDRGSALLVGGALTVLGLVAATWARTQPVRRLYGAQVVAVVGLLTVTASNAWAAENPAVGTTIALPLLVLAGVGLRRRLAPVAAGLGALAGLSWVVLVGIGLDRATTGSTAAWWSELRGWPLLVAAGAAASATVLATSLAPALRSVSAGLALAPLAAFVNAPFEAGRPTATMLVLCATLVVLAAATAFAPAVWARGAGVLAAWGAAGLGLLTAVLPWDPASRLPGTGGAALDRSVSAPDVAYAGWVHGVVALSVVVALLALVRLVPATHRSNAWSTAAVTASAVTGLGALDLVLALTPPLWAAVLASALVTALVAGVTWWVRDDAPASWVGSAATAYVGALSLALAASADLLTALVSTVALVALAVAFAYREREGAALAAAGCGALAVLSGGYALSSWGLVLGADAVSRAVALAVYAGLAALVAAPLSRRTTSRLALEASAVLVAVAAVAVAPDDSTLAMVLTILGTAAAVVAVTGRDRAVASWLGVVVLGAATVLRIANDVRAPELYTLPAAALLVAAGVWRLRTDRDSSSLTALGSGLVLALVPSLLLSLDEPVSLRGALTGVAAVVVLALGIQQRLVAPFVAGAAATALLAVRHLEPYADAVPRWISLGLLGVALLAVGITWEARLRDLRRARRYLVALR